MPRDEPLASSSAIRWQCHTCKEWHTGLPLDVAWDEPYYYSVLSDDARKNAFLDSDLCVIEDDYFIRGVIEIPIIGTSDHFLWGVWSSLSKKNFQLVVDHWDDPELDRFEPMFGWLSNRMDFYSDTLNLKVNVCLRSKGLRPRIIVQPTDHPLAVEQEQGITLARIQEINAQVLHS
ncbi:MAG TPA: DUF2199 domain-containing protein [Terriglobales bacterium]|nr:DUF2199 domain-containing protein [Terriglobales bacterium]